MVTIINWMLDYWANRWIAFGAYWLPLAVCSIGYTVRTFQNYQKDKANCTKQYYVPTDCIGTLIGRGIVTVIPLGNFLAAAFDFAPELLSGFFRNLAKVFNQPLVPSKYKAEQTFTV